MNLSDFDFALPDDLIAQRPPIERDGARMLVVHRATGLLEDRNFTDLPSYLRAGDCVVLNNTRVFPARLIGHTDTGARVEVFLLQAEGDRRWRALVKPGRKLRPATTVEFAPGFSATVLSTGERGERTIQFHGIANDIELNERIDALGHIPLPPYIHRNDADEDRARYQTVYADARGSVAAPTAGLHFTEPILQRIRDAGATIANVTLHVGLGTFQPIDREDFENHHLHKERFHIAPDAWTQIEAAKRVVAVGTTSVRTIESAARLGKLDGETDLFLYPGATFARTGAMLTNFHLPKSSLLLLVCAFGGTDLILRAYQHAVEQRYRFFSYGDCMLVL